MIPKIIHYCWFGGKPIPEFAKKCINSWKLFFPDYVIKEWNESNFNVNLIPFTQEAYSSGKFAFVSDVARFWILFHEGGIYFDTDVEVISSFDDIVSKGAFMGVEISSTSGTIPLVNPGLGLGAEAGNKVIRAILDYYSDIHFWDENGVQNPGTIVAHTTKVLVSSFNLQPSNLIQSLDSITIYPKDFFNPFDDLTGVLDKTKNTRSIHWYSKSWINRPSWYFKITRLLHRILGEYFFTRFRNYH